MEDGSSPPTSDTTPIAAASTAGESSESSEAAQAHAAADALPPDSAEADAARDADGGTLADVADGADVDDLDDLGVAGDAGDEWDTGQRPLPRLAALTGQTFAAWLGAAHAPYLVLSVAPVLVTAALLWAHHAPLVPGLLILTVLAASFVQAGAHLLDAYLESVRARHVASAAANAPGAAHGARRVEPLLRMGMDPLAILRAAVALLVVGACLGVPLALAGGVRVLLLGVAGLLCAFLYSATNYALKRLPLGELAVALAFGPGLVVLTALVQGQAVTPFALALGAGLGLVAAALVEAANLRALAPDVRDGRRTLVRLLGPAGGRRLYLATFTAAYLVVIIAAVWHSAPHGALAVLFSLPVAILPISGAQRARAAATLTLVVRGTLHAYAYFAFWIIMGLLLGGLYLRLLALAGA